MKRLLLASLCGVLWLSSAGCATTENPDPLEPFNRAVFAFNETLDKYAIEPVAKGYDFVVPHVAQEGIRNFFDNLNMPVVLANNLLQAKPRAALDDLARLVFNSTFGIAGFIDVASRVDVPKNDEDFGQTLGFWGVPPGAYLVVPILGPYTLRDGVGDIVDTAAVAWAYMTPFWYEVVGLDGPQTLAASVGVRAFELLNLRSIFLEEIAASRADAFDYYIFVRNAFLQNRRAKVLDQTDAPVIDEEDLYYFDEEEGFADEDEDYDDL